ncbi:hypothetical protein [Brevundimonas diminuta]|uniref:hypothetical protein n=1 Tax=Brevundimonas diminuta TaxID=293 RepID=UPI003D9A371F
MKMNKVVLVALCAAMMSGCVQNYASREVSQGAAAGSLTVANAPQDARLLVDGRDLGSVADLKAGAALTPGRHEVVIQQAGRRLHAQAVMVAAGARVEVVVP